MSRSHLVLALATGIVGLVAGRLLPRGAPSPVVGSATSAASAVALECTTERAQLASTRTQLAICMAYRAEPEPELEPGSPSSEAPAAAAPPEGLAGFAAWAQARKPHERLENYPEAVLVRRADGTRAIYRPNEHSSDSDDVYARKAIDGTITYYLGPDAGPRSDPDAWGSLRDLAGPDGTVVMGGTRLMRFGTPDAGAL